jgi:thiol:disulfide interchange protein
LGPLALFIIIYAFFENHPTKKYILFSISTIFFIFFILSANRSSKINLIPYKNQTYLLEEIEKEIPLIIQKEKKPVLFYFYADWCHSCKDLEERISRKEVGELILNGWILIKINVSDFDKYKEHLLNDYQVYGVPALSFFDKEGNLIKPFTMVGAEIPIRTLISILRQFGNFQKLD